MFARPLHVVQGRVQLALQPFESRQANDREGSTSASGQVEPFDCDVSMENERQQNSTSRRLTSARCKGYASRGKSSTSPSISTGMLKGSSAIPTALRA